MPASPEAARGEVWQIRFDPSEGDEIRKIRPGVVMTAHTAGRMDDIAAAIALCVGYVPERR